MTTGLENKRVLVTAGASGIGKEVAISFARAGAKVLVCDIAEDQLEACSGWDAPVTAVKCDVSKSSEVDRMFEFLSKLHGGIDVLVNNAGIAGPTKPIDEITDDEWDMTMRVNVNGQFYCARRAAAQMKPQNSGAIINLSSVAGRIGMPLRAPYSTSKYAVRGLTDVLAVELGEFGIRVNSILPGVIDGPRGKDVVEAQAAKNHVDPQDYLSAMLHNISLHSLIDMEEIAALAMYLASGAARNITAQHISVCGNFETYRSPLSIKKRDVQIGKRA
ncbi:SDR family oxidoreductase [Pacificoceanicola onchidii]|uniref:SDR family oxidoreductase n=1 Tax=Pacificoceanicola onchidii TaxID=2562685 RepID=UPI0010A46F46|nr:SDR family oxidoreductase [Pacificoceanicola onchidii]